MACTCLVNLGFARGTLLGRVNRGPWSTPLVVRYVSIAATGQISVFVFPTYTSTPWPYGSVFDSLRWIFKIEGFSWELTATSLGVRCFAGSNEVCVSTRSSPHLKNPKKASEHAAHNKVRSSGCEIAVRLAFMRLRISGVIGRRVCFFLGASRLIPLSTRSKRKVISSGLVNPWMMWRCLTPDK